MVDPSNSHQNGNCSFTLRRLRNATQILKTRKSKVICQMEFEFWIRKHAARTLRGVFQSHASAAGAPASRWPYRSPRVISTDYKRQTFDTLVHGKVNILDLSRVYGKWTELQGLRFKSDVCENVEIWAVCGLICYIPMVGEKHFNATIFVWCSTFAIGKCKVR